MTENGQVDCTRLVELLADYLAGELTRDEAELLEWHLDGCQPCVAFVNTYRGTIRVAKKLAAAEMPAELKQRLVAFLKSSSRAT
jgi:anti-sigma factor RsiW